MSLCSSFFRPLQNDDTLCIHLCGYAHDLAVPVPAPDVAGGPDYIADGADYIADAGELITTVRLKGSDSGCYFAPCAYTCPVAFDGRPEVIKTGASSA